MKNLKFVIATLGTTVLLSGCATQIPMHAADDPRFDDLRSDTLSPFQSKQAYKDWLQATKKLEAKRRKVSRAQSGEEDDIIIVTGSRQASPPNITNVQNQGVDEGDIVKQVGDHLVLMQDGRLFSLYIGSGTPRLSARINIYDTPDADIWYDELLISDRRLVVTGYHYGKNATEITVYNLDEAGQFTRQGRWYLESEDYYSDNNSATRMIGDTLIFHTQGDLEAPDAWPTLRDATETEGKSIVRAKEIFPPLLRMSDPDLHIVTECKISQSFDCQSRAVMAGNRAEWIVTETDGYLWVAPPRPDWSIPRKIGPQKREQPSTLYRFPLHSDEVEAVKLKADLPSRFAFEAREDRLFALVRAHETSRDETESKLAFLELPLSAFTANPSLVQDNAFTKLPGEPGYRLRMRFTDDHLVYSNFTDEDPVAYAVNLDTHLLQGPISVPHEITRLDRVDQNIILIGEGEIGRNTEVLGLSWLDLSTHATLTDTLSLPNRYEAEGRAQALNMKSDPDGSSLLGLPTFIDINGPNGWTHDEEDGTDISFARVSNFGQLTDLGHAAGDPSRIDPDYTCDTSCVDWYGNARPFFIGDRIFALIASELIELQETPTGISEVARVNLSSPL